MPSAISQSHFRFRWDNFNPDYAGRWIDAVDTNSNLGVGASQLRLRFTLQETGGVATASTTCKLQVSRNAGAFQDVTTASTVVQAAAISVSANNTQINVSQLPGTGTFITGALGGGTYSNTGATLAFTISANNRIEIEYGIFVLATNVVTDTLDFQAVTTAGTTITATLIPRITMIAQGGVQLTQQYVENINTYNPALNRVNLYQQYVENINSYSPSLNTVRLYQQYVEVLANKPTGRKMLNMPMLGM